MTIISMKNIFIFLIFLISQSALSNLNAKYFFSNPDLVNAKISPSGQFVALINGIGKDQKLNLIDIKSNKHQNLITFSTFSEHHAQIQFLDWIDDQYIGVQYSEIKKGINNILDTKKYSYLIIIRIPDNETPMTIKRVRTRGWLIDALPQEKNTFLYAKNGLNSKVYKIKPDLLLPHNYKLKKLDKIDGGQFISTNLIAEIKGHAYKWFNDEHGQIKAVFSFNHESKKLELNQIRQGEPPVKIKSWKLSDIAKLSKEKDKKLLLPIAPTRDPNIFYCFDYNEEQRQSVYKVNFRNSDEELIYQQNSFHIHHIIVSKKTNDLIGVEIIKDGVQYIDYLAKSTKQETNESSSIVFSRVIDSAIKTNRYIVYSEAHNIPGTFYIEHKKNDPIVIGSIAPSIKKPLKNRQLEGIINHQGLDVPYILTLPEIEKSKSPFPLIVISHGGPFYIYDELYYDNTAQFFASNGFAVLRVNFRGSGGYDEAYVEAGKRQWGKLMLEDIYQSTITTINREDINANEVCALGLSYGGYASTMLTIKYPDVFKCAVSIAGVMDVNLLLNNWSSNKKNKEWLNSYWGDPFQNYDEIMSLSPSFLTKKLRRPIYIIHGENDEVVHVEHAHRMKLMLQKHNKQFQSLILPSEGHHLSDQNNRIKIFDSSLTFIKEHIKKL